MPTKKWLTAVLLAALAISTGCCGFRDRWCGAPQVAQASPGCCCPTPCYSPGSVPVPAATGWNQQGAVCPPCAR